MLNRGPIGRAAMKRQFRYWDGGNLHRLIGGLVLASYLAPLLLVLAISTPSSAQEARLFADLRAGICLQLRPVSEDPEQRSKFNDTRSHCALCKHPAASAPDGSVSRLWESLAWTRLRPQHPPTESARADQTDCRVLRARGPPSVSA